MENWIIILPSLANKFQLSRYWLPYKGSVFDKYSINRIVNTIDKMFRLIHFLRKIYILPFTTFFNKNWRHPYQFQRKTLNNRSILSLDVRSYEIWKPTGLAFRSEIPLPCFYLTLTYFHIIWIQYHHRIWLTPSSNYQISFVPTKVFVQICQCQPVAAQDVWRVDNQTPGGDISGLG